MSSIKSKHTLLTADECFSRSMFKTSSAFKDARQAIKSLHKLPSLIRSRIQVWKKQLQYRMFIQLGDIDAGVKLATETLTAAEQNKQFEPL